MHASRLPLALLALTGLIQTAAAQVITVTLCADTIDINASTATVAELPGPDGEVSLSEALIAANNTPGHQTIHFAIPTSKWQLQFLYPGRAILTSLSGFYWRAFDEVTIDATTQTAFTGDTNPIGGEVVLYRDDLFLNAANCTVIGLDSTDLSIASNTLVESNTGTTNITVGGSNNTIRGNTGGTIWVSSSDNVVVGNTVQRIRVIGGGSTSMATNNRIGGPDQADRNYITGYGTWNSEGIPSGKAIQLFYNRGTLIENNRIGTTPDGLAQGNQACTIGISLDTDNQDITIRDNRIAGILGLGKFTWAGTLWGWAVYFWGSTSNVELVGNTIGLDANDDPVLGSVWGVNVDNFSGYTVSGVRIVDNVIAGHVLTGVRVGPTANMRISGTEIHANGMLGIDLVGSNFASGVTANDPLDADTGGNGLQNFPVLTSAAELGGSLRAIGTLHSSPLDDFTIELFASATCDPSGFGQGEVFLGSASVTTNASGDAGFDVTLPASVPMGWVVTATATLEPLGVTSEFSACVPVSSSGCAPGSVSKRMAGTNLDVYTATKPVIGQDVTFTIDTSGFQFATIFGVGNSFRRPLDTGDWLLINVDSPILFMAGPLPGPIASTTRIVSSDSAMCGVTIFTQVKLHNLAKRPFRLTNSQDLRLGS